MSEEFKREIREINYTDDTARAADREIRRLEKEGFHLALTRLEKDGSITVVMGRLVKRTAKKLITP